MNALLWVVDNLEILAGAMGLVGMAFAWLKRREKVTAWRLGRAIECLEIGVRETYEEYVRSIKRAREDGKLTDDERREALTQAIARARSYAAQEGFDLLKVYAKEYLPVLIEKIVRRDKAAAAPFALSSGPAPDWP